MSDDQTHKLPGDKDSTETPAGDKIDLLIVAVQSLSGNVHALHTAVKDFQARLEALETTATGNSLNTKPIWERALAEIAETRAELAETRAELAETRAELKAELAETRTELKAELAETRAELRAEIAETREVLRNEMNDGFRKLGSKMEVINEDLLTLRANQRLLERRVETLESKVP